MSEMIALPKSVCDNCVNTECLWRAPTGGNDPPVMVCPHKIEKPKTNADRIRAMTDEELAMLLGTPTIVSPPWCDMNYDCPYIDQDPARCDLCALDWLKQEAQA